MRKGTLLTAMLILAVMLFAPSGIHAAGNGVLPFTFSAGTTAKASEVNENFQFVNYGNLVLIDGNGIELGTLIYYLGDKNVMYMNNNGFFVKVEHPSDFTLIPPKTDFNTISIMQRTFYYLSSDCTGIAYAERIGISELGTVYSNKNIIYYIPKNASPLSINYNSINYGYKYSQECYPQSGVADVYPVTTNDPVVTGESSLTKTPPLRIIRRTK